MIIGLTGLAGSGKSTVANHLVANHGFVVHKFAGPLKNMCRALGMTEAMIEGDEKETPIGWLGCKTPRYVMQTLGSEWGRDTISKNLWIDAWYRTWPKGPFVTDDVRFSNEADAILEAGGKVIRIVRPGLQAQGHASETEMASIDVDHTIVNDDSIADLIKKVEAILASP